MCIIRVLWLIALKSERVRGRNSFGEFNNMSDVFLPIKSECAHTHTYKCVCNSLLVLLLRLLYLYKVESCRCYFHLNSRAVTLLIFIHVHLHNNPCAQFIVVVRQHMVFNIFTSPPHQYLQDTDTNYRLPQLHHWTHPGPPSPTFLL